MTFPTRLFFIALTTLVVASACGDDEDDDNFGTLQQGWTIAGTTDPAACIRTGATQMRIVVLDPGLFVEATQFAPCEDFATTLRLDDNNYTASATFLDANGVAVSETRTVAVFSIAEDRTTTLSIDFPLAAFLPR